jgi:hypothetical protein
MASQPRAGRRVPSRTRDPGIPCGWVCIGGFLTYFNFRKHIFPLKNPTKSILNPKIVKPFPENF